MSVIDYESSLNNENNNTHNNVIFVVKLLRMILQHVVKKM